MKITRINEIEKSKICSETEVVFGADDNKILANIFFQISEVIGYQNSMSRILVTPILSTRLVVLTFPARELLHDLFKDSSNSNKKVLKSVLISIDSIANDIIVDSEVVKHLKKLKNVFDRYINIHDENEIDYLHPTPELLTFQLHNTNVFTCKFDKIYMIQETLTRNIDSQIAKECPKEIEDLLFTMSVKKEELKQLFKKVIDLFEEKIEKRETISYIESSEIPSNLEFDTPFKGKIVDKKYILKGNLIIPITDIVFSTHANVDWSRDLIFSIENLRAIAESNEN